MKILVINCGSSTLKFQVIALDEATPLGRERRLGHGLVDRIGRPGEIRFVAENGESFQETDEIADHAMAARRVFEWLKSLGLLGNDGIEAVGHRVVHGGHRFIEPTPIDDRVIDVIETMRYLAPLHNDPSLKAIRAARMTLDADLPMVAVFDTAFHAGMPEHSSHYAILQELAVKHHIRRYGFHGLAHRYMTERYAWMNERALEQVKLVTLQLGNGCSAAAIDKGHSVDTSMGFTPLEGLMMGTRSGDVDPHLPGLLAQREGITLPEAEVLLNTKSGLLGVSGYSQDMRELLQRKSDGDQDAALAVKMFCYRVKKQIGAYLSVLGEAEAESLSTRGVQGDGALFFDSLYALDRVTSAAMWVVVHETYAQTVYLDGQELRPEDFKPNPEGHTGGALNMVPAYAGYMAINAITGHTRSWIMGQGHCVAAIDTVNFLLDNMTPAHAERYSLTDEGVTRYVRDFYSYRLRTDGKQDSPLGSHSCHRS